MTVSSQTNNETFTGNGVTTIWDLPFRFFDNADILAYLIDPVAFTTTPLALGTDYTLSGAGLPEQFGTAPGQITTTVPVAGGKQLYVERTMAVEQLTDIVNQGRFFPEVHEDVFDRLTMLIQQNAASSRGAIRVALSDPEPARLPVAGLRANLLMGFDGLGNPIPVAPVNGSAAALALLLANEALVSQGAAMIGRGAQVVSSIAALRTLLKSSPSKNAFATGYRTAGDGGGGPYSLDLADVTSADNGGTVIVAADGGRWKLSQQGPVNVKQFGLIEGVFDAPTQAINNAALLASRNWVAAGSARNQLVFTAGTYGYSVHPNWAIQHAVIIASGEVRLRYFGTGNAVILDLGPTANTFLFDVTAGPFIVEAPSTAQHGVYVRSIHHSKLQFKVRGAGTNYAGVKIEFAVCTDFTGSSCYPNDDGNWYLGAKPKYGLWASARNAGEQVSYSYFGNTIWEGLDQAAGAGILLDGALGNVFVGGTAERCNHGLITTPGAVNNRFYGVDFEANQLARDILENGQGNEYHGVDSATLITVGNTALFPKFYGGSHETVEIATGARWPLFNGLNVNRFGTPGGGFTNGEPTSMFRDCIDLQTQTITPLIQGTITVTASPFSYTNLTGNSQTVSVGGGTGVALTFTRAGVDVALSQQIGTFLLSPGDTLKTAYTAAPNMNFWQR